MATNLRLSEAAATAVREEAKRSGRSQQDVIREAVDRYLARPGLGGVASDQGDFRERLIPPRTKFQREIARVKLPSGVSSLDLLDREDRI